MTNTSTPIQFSITQLFVLIASFAIALYIVVHLTFPRMRGVRCINTANAHGIKDRIDDRGLLHSYGVNTINDWLANRLSSEHPLSKALSDVRLKTDTYGSNFQCVLIDAETRTLGIYSNGEDRQSTSFGNDPDDINTWTGLELESRNSEFVVKAVICLLTTPVFYLAFQGVARSMEACRKRFTNARK